MIIAMTLTALRGILRIMMMTKKTQVTVTIIHSLKMTQRHQILEYVSLISKSVYINFVIVLK